MNTTASPLTLITIPFSHYCEKSRWMLDLAGMTYREEPHLPILHRFATKRAGGSSVPVLVAPKAALTDSTDILHWVDAMTPLLPQDPAARTEALAFEDHCDRVLGPHLRRVMYFHLLQSRPAMDALLPLAPRREARLARLSMPLFKAFMRRSLRLTPDGTARSLSKVEHFFGEVSARLDDGKRWLFGDAFSAADLTFAALASPALMPPEHPIPWPPEAALPDAVRELRDRLRATPAGDLGLRAYAEHRRR
jgi:glutathione S-transferase